LTSQPPPKKKKAGKDTEVAVNETEDDEGVVQEDGGVGTAGVSDSTTAGAEESAEMVAEEGPEVAPVASGSAEEMHVDEPEPEARKASLDYHRSVYLLSPIRRFTLSR
jgi:hypothetical protein